MTLNDIKLLYVIIKNIRSKAMNRKMIGYSITEKCPAVSLKDVELFAEATGDRNTAGYRKNSFAPPFFLSKQIMSPIKKILLHKDLKLNMLKLVHSMQEVTWYSQLKIGDQLFLELKIIDISKISSGEQLTILMTGNVDNNKIIEGTVNIIIRGPGKRPGKKVIKEEEKKEIFRITISTEDGQQYKYAKISGDNNFIHTSKLVAKAAGLPGTIMHGACVMAMTCNTLMASLIRNDIKRLAGMSVRFAYPAIPGEMLELIGYKGNNKNEILFSLLNSKGREVLKDGIFRFK